MIDPNLTRKPPAPARGGSAGFGRRARRGCVFPRPGGGQARAQPQSGRRAIAGPDAGLGGVGRFQLVQPNADTFAIVKRTNPQSTWLQAGAGHRASGLVFGQRQRGAQRQHPEFLAIVPRLAGSTATPRGKADCLRLATDGPPWTWRYDIKAHGLDAVYEDVQPGFGARHGHRPDTSELTLLRRAACDAGDSPDLAQRGELPPLLVCSAELPARHGCSAPWTRPSLPTPLKRLVEDHSTVDRVYEKEVEQRHWYGFWYFGNVMHSYDEVRHVWRYDLGGMAWDNTELASDVLWYGFPFAPPGGYLPPGRGGDAQHERGERVLTSGVSPGLGSRHNVVPWGCGAGGADQPGRLDFLVPCTDERVGDLMDEVANADFEGRRIRMRSVRRATGGARGRSGTPTQSAAPRLARFHRQLDDQVGADRRHQVARQDGFPLAMPLRLPGPSKILVYGYDPKTGKLYQVSDELREYNLRRSGRRRSRCFLN